MSAIKQRAFAAPIAAAASLSSGIDLGGAFQYVYLEIPVLSTLSGATPIYVQGSSDNSTFRRLAVMDPGTAAAAANDLTIASAASNRIVLLPVYGLQYLKVEVSGTATQSTGFKIIAGDST